MGRIPEKLTDKDISEVTERLKTFQKEKKLTQRELAKMLGVGVTKFNQILRGQYKSRKSIYEVIRRAAYLIDAHERKKRIEQRGFVETSVARQVEAIIARTEALSMDEGKIGLIIGDGGHGKSICLQQYARANLNCQYIELDDMMQSKSIFAALADKLVIDSTGSLSDIKTRVEERLRNEYAIIILDEAAGLTVRQLNQLRQVITVKTRCPMILAGNADLLKTVMQPKTRRGCESLDQFTSRLSYILNLDEMANTGESGLYSAEDIRKLYEYGGIRLTGGAVQTLKKISKTPRSGRLRTCTNVIVSLHTDSTVRKKKAISAQDIVDVIAELKLPVRAWLPVGQLEKAAEKAAESAKVKAG